MSIIGRVGIRGKIALSVALCSILWIAVVLSVHGDMRSDPQYMLPMDHHKYLAMAQQDVGAFRIAPFCWRIGAPALAGAIGGDPWLSMFALTALGLVLTICAVALLVWDATLSKMHVAGVCVTVLAMGWLTRTSVWNPATVDMLACGLMMTSVYLATRTAWMWSALLLCCAVLVKESALLALPIMLVIHNRASWKRLVVWVLPAVVLVGMVRVVIPSGNADASYLAALPDTLRLVQHGTSTYSLSYLFSTIAADRVLQPSPTDLWALTGDSIGMIVMIMVLSVAWNLPSRRWWLILLCLITASQVLVAVNVQRVVLIAGPALAAIGWMYLNGTQLGWARTLLLYLGCGLLVVTTFGTRESASLLAQLVAVSVLGAAYLRYLRRHSRGIHHA